ncbi:nicotinate-nucleotide adenylyltransferase [Oceanobacillus chungangensis]|uniref:Probable nicotinate-nucleotide adenylyltransferase n=1 Tax=Oceanobacillus chungangensis TaxID=1229152 RepID=A0A3D8Q1K8_9BACI|nr:nicotinate-nucleotide adenylyltransferase [Oceanobacillus chungangensis]RDW21737.1 nicotinic acid mononucleotide adenylyltransferase [Oceanobacillus chungangensis]
MRRIGILGGTFDPPHLGHLLIAEEVRLTLDLEEIWFIPTYTPPHKDEAKTSATDRINMLDKALGSNPFFKINTIEVERLGKSYTFDTMIMLTEEFPEDEFYFIIGADMVEYLPNWHKIEELVNIVQFVGVKRSGYKLQTEYPVIEVEIPLIDISSSMLRERLRSQQSVKYLVPDVVTNYIREKALYGKK